MAMVRESEEQCATPMGNLRQITNAMTMEMHSELTTEGRSKLKMLINCNGPTTNLWWATTNLDTIYVLCRARDESVDHLFTQCVFIKYIMVMGLEDVRTEELGNDVLVVWDKWMRKATMRGRSNGLSELVACWWTIWKVRNNLIFINQKFDPVLAVERLKILLSSWKDLL
ncbi:uncharacterized protein LOC109719281 [Ananas comosus]|uniref:Uncharacterized protein LOC109719281 n=1 Tax=Ananas comosus TaxID=4615 RepID=A0A6P5G866_ANACO|nr:uncharacterized protein LOC109719281 [Ananas comosus]